MGAPLEIGKQYTLAPGPHGLGGQTVTLLSRTPGARLLFADGSTQDAGDVLLVELADDRQSRPNERYLRDAITPVD